MTHADEASSIRDHAHERGYTLLDLNIGGARWTCPDCKALYPGPHRPDCWRGRQLEKMLEQQLAIPCDPIPAEPNYAPRIHLVETPDANSPEVNRLAEKFADPIDYTYLILTGKEDMTRLLICRECWALVPPIHRPDHVAWHLRLAGTIERIA